MDFPGVDEYEVAVQGPVEESLLWDNPDYSLGEGDFIETVDPMLDSEELSEQLAGVEFRETRAEITDGAGSGFGISTINFDTVEDIVWTGNQGGHVSSYYGPILQKYTSFQVDPKLEVRQVRCLENGIIALTQNSLRFQSRRGLPMHTHTSENMIEMQSLLCYSPTSLLMGGHQEKVIDFDLTTNSEKKTIDIGENGCAMLRQHNRYICAGNAFGRIEFKDPITLKTEHTLDTHSGSLSDFDVEGNYLITCGFSNSRQGLSVDRFLMVYDLRQMKAINPLQTMVYPFLLKFLPTYSTRIIVVSPLGQMQVLDTIYANTQPSLMCLYQVATGGAMITSLDVSTTSQCISFGDSMGSIHLMTSNVTEPQFNSFSRPTEFFDTEAPEISIDIEDDTTPLSVLPIAYNANSLLSDWPEEFSKKVHRTTPTIDEEILKTMKMQGSIGYAPNPRPQRRRQKISVLSS